MNPSRGRSDERQRSPRFSPFGDAAYISEREYQIIAKLLFLLVPGRELDADRIRAHIQGLANVVLEITPEIARYREAT